MSPATSPYFTVSVLMYPRPLWRYVILFQSWAQFQSWAMIVLLCAFLMQGTMLLFGAPLLPVAGMLFAMALGSLCSVFMVVPAQINVSSSAGASLRFVVAQLEEMRYVEGARSADRIVYRQKLPRLLRWQEGEVAIQFEPGIIQITGAKFILEMIRRTLLKRNENAHE